jgi:hypothetical protein
MGSRVQFDIERTLTAPFNGSYQTIGSSLTESGVIVIFDNQSDVVVELSADGVNTFKTLTSGSAFILDCRTNHGTNLEFMVPAGSQFYAKGSAGNGQVSISVIYSG